MKGNQLGAAYLSMENWVFVSITESTCRLLIAPVMIVLLCKGVDSMTNISLEVME